MFSHFFTLSFPVFNKPQQFYGSKTGPGQHRAAQQGLSQLPWEVAAPADHTQLGVAVAQQRAVVDVGGTHLRFSSFQQLFLELKMVGPSKNMVKNTI